jgi:hypothetical protein
MKRICWVALIVGAMLGLTPPSAQAWHPGFVVGINLGPPCCYRPWGYYGPWPYYYPSYPVYIAPPPVVVQPAPVVAPVAAAPSSPPVYQAGSAPAPQGQPTQPTQQAQVTLTSSSKGVINAYLADLAHPEEHKRCEACLQLGKMRVEGVIDPLGATLAGDKSPVVREAAARALGLIGSPKGLAALKYAAQVDSDRDVRRTAQFAVEIIQSQMKR